MQGIQDGFLFMYVVFGCAKRKILCKTKKSIKTEKGNRDMIYIREKRYTLLFA